MIDKTSPLWMPQIRRQPQKVQIQDLKNLGERPEQISEIITICWYRIIFLELPPKQKIKHKKSLLATPCKLPQ